MGRSVRTDIVPHVARLGDEFPRNWVGVWDADECGKSKRLIADLYVKIEDNKLYSVFLINTSPYAAGGSIDYSVFAPTPEQIEDLKKGELEEEEVLGAEYTECTFIDGQASVCKLLLELGISTNEIKAEDAVSQTL